MHHYDIFEVQINWSGESTTLGYPALNEEVHKRVMKGYDLRNIQFRQESNGQGFRPTVFAVVTMERDGNICAACGHDHRWANVAGFCDANA